MIQQPTYNCKIFKVYNVMVWYMYKLWKDSSIEFIHTSISSHAYLFFFFFGVERTFKFCFLSKFQIYNTVLSAIAMSYIRSWDLIHNWNIVSFYKPLPIYFAPEPLTTPFLLRFYEFDFLLVCFWFHIKVIPCSICLAYFI